MRPSLVTSDVHNSKIPMDLIASVRCVNEVKTNSTSILERLFTAQLDAGECPSSLRQVPFAVRLRNFRFVTRNTDKPYVGCTTCKKRAPTEVEAVQDALRIGQEALDKVTALQDSGTGSGSWGSTTPLNALTRGA